MRRGIWGLLATLIAGAAGTAVVWVAVGEFGSIELSIILSLIGIFLSLASGVAALRLWELPRIRPIAALALVAVPFELAAFIDGAWYGEFFGEGESTTNDAKWFVTAFVWALASLLVTTAVLQLWHRRVRWTAFPATIFAVSGAAVATVMVWSNVDDNDWGRALAVLAITTAAAWLLGAFGQRALTGPKA